MKKNSLNTSGIMVGILMVACGVGLVWGPHLQPQTMNTSTVEVQWTLSAASLVQPLLASGHPVDDYERYLLDRARDEADSLARTTVRRIYAEIQELGNLHRPAIVAELHGARQVGRSAVTGSDDYVGRVVSIVLKHLSAENSLEQLIDRNLEQFMYDLSRYEEWVLVQSGVVVNEYARPGRSRGAVDEYFRIVAQEAMREYAEEIRGVNRTTLAVEGVFGGVGVATIFMKPIVLIPELGSYYLIHHFRDVQARGEMSFDNVLEEFSRAVVEGCSTYPGLYESMTMVSDTRFSLLEKVISESEFKEARHFSMEERVSQ